tara:strand:- start:7670 stop:7972 length:303 start_codon:yes stop_codon:yes gene_type:complete
MSKLFVYGSLLDDTVRERVLNKQIEGEEDSVRGFRVDTHSFLTSFPSVYRDKDEIAKGKVFEVTEKDLKRLDTYETKFYRRIKVKTMNGHECETYMDSHY